MKVCMLAYTFYETDNRVMRYAEALVKRGDNVDVVALKRKGQSFHETIDGVNLYRIQEREVNEKSQLSYMVRVLRFLIKSGWFVTKKHLKSYYDVIHVHSVPDFEVFSALIPMMTGAKIILDIHDIVPELFASKFKVKKSSFLFKLLILVEKFSIAFSNHIIVSNHIWEKKLKSRSIMSKKITTILNYPDRDLFYKKNESKADGRFVIMYPGTLNWHQGIDIAIKAMGIIKEEIHDADLHIYGEGPSKEYLKSLINRFGLQNRIFVCDFIPVKKIAKVMANADMGIIPKRNDSFGGEAFSTKILEFMSMGIPVIVSKTKIDQLYFNDSIVKFFKPEDEKNLAQSIRLMIKDAKLRAQLSENALKFVEKNNWQIKQKIYLDIVDSLKSKKNKRYN